ncbi:MAG: division/cell wall cluster transcriptional repressor MraZ [Ruminococcus sp.]|nr:division/cell wall cluster transcriptional repressor MraZ [Ruminococcus sp.]
MREPLIGTYTPSIDAKGRVSFPTKLRDILGPEFYLCMSHDGRYLAVFSVEEFNKYCEKLFEITGTDGEQIRREVFSGAEKQAPDKQGRIFISQNLRERAGIKDEITIIGNLNRCEIWANDKLEATKESVSAEKREAIFANISL